ncbi:hypothetical protein ScalyP_jg11146 [Parmales sp. scaly parma]|nr:hypothetical protein ScalyP_jg11146 [Parmales sp. scaly parma]
MFIKFLLALMVPSGLSYSFVPRSNAVTQLSNKQSYFHISTPPAPFSHNNYPATSHTVKPITMMPIGVPKVAYRVPGAPQADWVDIYNRLYRERIIFLAQEINDEIANQIIGVLLYLDSEDSTKPIYLYINSPGGSVTAGLALYDTMQHVKSEVVTINVGLAASMGSFILAAGAKGKRLALPNSRVMIHQPMGGAQGQAADIKIEARQIMRIRDNLVRMYSKMTGKTEMVITEALDRDNFMSAEAAKEFGLIDDVIQLDDVAKITRENGMGLS